jgi:AraC family transcriptional regulator
MHFQISERWLACQIADYPGTTIGHAEIALVPKHSDLFMLQVGLSLVEELRTSRSIANRLATESAALLLGLHLVRRYRRDPISAGASKRGGLAAWQLRRVKSAMETAENTFSLEELAAMIGISATHFCTAFRESTGLPPHKWQMQRRIERAKALLSDFRLSLTEIALACGYGSSSHFARSFRRATGMTPSEYRRAR